LCDTVPVVADVGDPDFHLSRFFPRRNQHFVVGAEKHQGAGDVPGGDSAELRYVGKSQGIAFKRGKLRVSAEYILLKALPDGDNPRDKLVYQHCGNILPFDLFYIIPQAELFCKRI
jgi:hypothetical protein